VVVLSSRPKLEKVALAGKSVPSGLSVIVAPPVAPSLAKRLSMVAGQLLLVVTQPIDQLELALSENRIEALRLTASALAVCNPFWMDSAAVRTREFFIQVA